MEKQPGEGQDGPEIVGVGRGSNVNSCFIRIDDDVS